MPLEHFITRQGNRLMEGEREFRFMGASMPGLFFPYDYTLQIPERMRLATRWEQEDGFRTLDQMNMRATRTWTCLPIRHPDHPGPTWHHVQAPGVYNEDSLRNLDQALALANQYGVRVVFSLNAAQDYFIQGGIGTWAAHRGKARGEFYADPQLREDFQQVVHDVVLRRNSVTGVLYRDDPAILAWQLGNEMQDATDEWVSDMAAYLKRLDPNHLVAETRSYPSDPFIIDPNVDLHPRHYYPDYPSVQQGWVESVRQELEQLQGQRPLLIGEFGPYVNERMFARANVVPKLREFLSFLCATEGVCGALLWSMTGHHQDGGFTWHQVFVYPEVWSYHWPGFPSAAAHAEQGILGALREAAFAIEGRPVEPVPVPEPPELLPVSDIPLLSWRGSAGASGYDVERAPEPEGPWSVVAANVSDADVAYRPLFSDTTARAGETWHYRILARNASGVSAASKVRGPVSVRQVCLVDELQDFSQAIDRSPGLTLTNAYNGLYAEYLFRAVGEAGDWITYRVSGEIDAVTVIAFYTAETARLTVEVSADGQQFVRLCPRWQEQQLPSPPAGHLSGQRRTLTQSTCDCPRGAHIVRIRWNGPAELDRVEIFHSGTTEEAGTC